MRRVNAATLALVVAGCSDLPTEPPPARTSLEPPANAAALLVSVSTPYVGCGAVGTLAGGALFQICFPENWNGDVVLWAHGYVAPQEALAIPDDMVGDRTIGEIVLSLRFAYATTSYRRNGLVAVDAVDDLVQLAHEVHETAAGVRNVYLVGASEGGLATALALENQPGPFDGGLIACAPVGSFRGQVNYLGDVRVLFDYFFPGVLPGDPVNVPADLIDNWDSHYELAVRAALAAKPANTAQLIRTGGIAIDPSAPASAIESIVDALWYNVFATNDAASRLGGNPYDNRLRWYSGSKNDLALNLRVRRVRASSAALSAMRAYEADGDLRRPAQMIHTDKDPVVPYWHAAIYQTEALFRSGFTLLSFPSHNYGHCAFDEAEVLASFAVLVLRVTGANLLALEDGFRDHASIARFQRLAALGGAIPEVWTRTELEAELGRF